jgi:hypothetical protein
LGIGVVVHLSRGGVGFSAGDMLWGGWGIYGGDEYRRNRWAKGRIQIEWFRMILILLVLFGDSPRTV